MVSGRDVCTPFMSLVYSSTGQSNPLRLFEMSFCFGSGDTFGGSRSRFTVNIDVSWLHIHLIRELEYMRDAGVFTIPRRLYVAKARSLSFSLLILFSSPASLLTEVLLHPCSNARRPFAYVTSPGLDADPGSGGAQGIAWTRKPIVKPSNVYE